MTRSERNFGVVVIVASSTRALYVNFSKLVKLLASPVFDGAGKSVAKFGELAALTESLVNRTANEEHSAAR